MKAPKSKWFWAIIAAAGLLAGWYFFTGDNEPRYDGLTLSHWFREYCSTRQGSESVEALQAFGTNAVPYLLEQAFDPSQDSALTSNLHRVLNGMLPRSWNMHFISAEERRNYAGFVLKDLKPPAALMMPVLKKHLASTNQPGHNQALYLLGTIGDGAEQGIPYLEAAVRGKDAWARSLALQALGWLGPKAKPAVPAISDVLQNAPRTNSLGFLAAITLGRIGSNAAPALPLVKTFFDQQTDPDCKSRMAGVILQIDETQTDALNFLVQTLTNSATAKSATPATYHLGEVGPNARGAAPYLLATLENAKGPLFVSAADALKKIGVPASTIISRLKKHLSATNDQTRFDAAARILQMDPADHEAHLVLIQLVRTQSIFRFLALETLRRAGPAAAEVLPALREYSESAPHTERKDALKAILSIEKKPR